MDRFAFQDGQMVVFIGDSITDCGRRAEHKPFGNGYVKLAIDLITARYPERRITYFNEGISGNTVRDLRARWERDVIAHDPDWVSVMIGINDLHRTLNETPEAVPVDEYEWLYRECLRMTVERTKAKLILLDPFYISVARDDPYEGRVLRMLDEYLEVVGKLADEFEAVHIKTHNAFQKQLKYRPREHFCPEPVHPYPSGHMVIALALLEGLGW